jgi:hypothetical protein
MCRDTDTAPRSIVQAVSREQAMADFKARWLL